MPDRGPLKVLVVEDESIVALDIENMLEEMGCVVVASVPRLVKALNLAESLDFDLAVLDINLAGEVVYPLAFRLAQRGTPFLFTTGYSTRACRTSCAIGRCSGSRLRWPASRRRWRWRGPA